MIIKGLLRRYERWNPVHPTADAFWGMGIGVGCGIGWGPGFGPEVIGYVGSGCGVGFNVGFTLLGVGIGLPANYIYTVPYNAAMFTKNCALEITRSNHAHHMGVVSGDQWDTVRPRVVGLHQKARGVFSDLWDEEFSQKQIEFSDLRAMVFSRAELIRDHIQKLSAGFFPPKKICYLEFSICGVKDCARVIDIFKPAVFKNNIDV